MPTEDVCDQDQSNKLKVKAYADAKRGAMPKSPRIGKTVLLKAEKSNKFLTNFSLNPLSGSEDWKRANSERKVFNQL